MGRNWSWKDALPKIRNEGYYWKRLAIVQNMTLNGFINNILVQCIHDSIRKIRRGIAPFWLSTGVDLLDEVKNCLLNWHTNNVWLARERTERRHQRCKRSKRIPLIIARSSTGWTKRIRRHFIWYSQTGRGDDAWRRWLLGSIWWLLMEEIEWKEDRIMDKQDLRLERKPTKRYYKNNNYRGIHRNAKNRGDINLTWSWW